MYLMCVYELPGVVNLTSHRSKLELHFLQVTSVTFKQQFHFLVIICISF
jgi:hypothetical protein